MAFPQPEVRPGDLITADQMNALIQFIKSLDGRVTALEQATPGQTGAPVITSPQPTATFRIGDVLQVAGRNFGLSSLIGVTLEGQRIDPASFQAGSGDTLLIFTIPPIPNIPDAGRTVRLTVSTSLGADATTFTLLPAAAPVLPDGQLFIHLSQSPQGNITAGGSFDFVFDVQALTNMDESYTLTPAVQTDQGAAAWTATIVNDQDQPIGNDLKIAASPPPDGSVTSVRVRVAVPAQNAGTAGRLALKVTSKRNPTKLTNASGDVVITPGAAPPPPQDKVVLTFSRVLAPGQGGASGVSLPASASPGTPTKVQVEFSLSVKDAGTYNFAAPQFDTNPNNLWNAQIKGQTSASLPAGTTNFVLPVVLFGVAGAAPTGMTVKVTSAGDAAVSGQLRLNVKLA